jgi:leader peptidase (prepilin peptidase) / N-methyltransferase
MLYLIAIIYGLLIGNYTTTAYFRIPRSILINGIMKERGKAPHCSVCRHSLRFYEYFPLLSWIFTRFKCNYCGVDIDPVYTFLELGGMIISLSLFLLLGMNEFYVVSTTLGGALLLNFVLFLTYGKFYRKALYAVLLSMLLCLVMMTV